MSFLNIPLDRFAHGFLYEAHEAHESVTALREVAVEVAGPADRPR